MTEISEVIDALKVTSNTVGGNGMLMCAGAIDWAIEKIAELTNDSDQDSLLKEQPE